MDGSEQLASNIKFALFKIHTKVALESLYLVANDAVLVKLRGRLNGRSLKYAGRKRIELSKAVELASQESETEVVVQFELDDAIYRATEAIRSAVELGGAVDVVSIDVSVLSSGSSRVYMLVSGVEKASVSKKISKDVEAVLSTLGGHLVDFQIVYDGDMAEGPSQGVILLAVRVTQPCTLSEIGKYIESRRISLPRGKWLRHRIDRLRQSGDVSVLKDGTIFLSAQNMDHMQGRVGKKTPDVERALHIAKQIW